MTYTLETLPVFVKEQIQQLSVASSLSPELLFKEYIERYEDDFIQTDQQFQTDEQRHRYCAISLVAKHTRSPVFPYNLLILGYESTFQFKNSGGTKKNLMVCDITKQPPTNRVVILREDQTKIVSDLVLFSKYSGVMLGQYASGELVADSRAKFGVPEVVKGDPYSMFKDIFKIPEITVANAHKNLSRFQKGSDKYVDNLDWRIITGMINSSYPPKEGKFSAAYYVNDGTVYKEEERDGFTVTPNFPVYISPEFQIYDTDSVCHFIGTVSARAKEKQPKTVSMNAFCVLPVHVIRKDMER